MAEEIYLMRRYSVEDDEPRTFWADRKEWEKVKEKDEIANIKKVPEGFSGKAFRKILRAQEWEKVKDSILTVKSEVSKPVINALSMIQDKEEMNKEEWTELRKMDVEDMTKEIVAVLGARSLSDS